jgi:ADP-ribosyl-[dinitrogen reductase] hydrolase
MPSEIRTSATHALEIAWLGDAPPDSLVGLTFAPGKWHRSTYGHEWQRDLDADLDALLAAGTSVLGCLLEDHELPHYRIPDLLHRAASRGLEVLRLPIRDVDVPTDLGKVEAFLAAVDQHVAEGRRVVIHCIGGLGRTGTLSGCYLVRRGVPVPEAFARLRRVRGERCPETNQQRAFIEKYQPHCATPRA